MGGPPFRLGGFPFTFRDSGSDLTAFCFDSMSSRFDSVAFCFEQVFSVHNRRMLAANKFSAHRVAVRVNSTIAAGFESQAT